MFSAPASLPVSVPAKKQDLEFCAFFNENKHAEFNFLSNFYLRTVKSPYGLFRCSEGLYQYLKFAHLNDENLKKQFMTANGQEAWDLSRQLAAKTDTNWAQKKVEAMEHALRCKFNEPDMKRKLLETRGAYLVENSPNGHDAFWADNGDGTGQNRLGQMLMSLRGFEGGTGEVPRPAILDVFYSHKCDHCENCCHFTNKGVFFNFCDTHMTHELKLGNFTKPIHLSDIPDGTGRFLYFKTNDIPELVDEGARLIADRIQEMKLENPFFVTPGDSTIAIAHDLRTRYGIDGLVIGKSKKPTDIETFKVDYCAITSTDKKSLYLNAEEAGKMVGKDIVVFDNVCTTGETLRAVYELLLKAGVRCEKIVEAIALFTEGQDMTEIPIADNKTMKLHRFCHLPLFPTDPSVDKSQYRLYSATSLPTEYGLGTLAVYHDRTGRSDKEAIAYYAAGTFDQGRKDIPVRVHDACATSELFHSVKCDCRLQLEQAMEYTAKHGGIIIYLNQEGRGIGLGNKIAAYKLQQEQGLDTVQANRALGLPDDVRKYEAVRDILKNLGVESIQLISNNPRKTDCLTKLGVNVTGTIPCVVQATHAPMQHYMQTKASAMGHAIPKSDAVKQGIIFIMGGPGSGKGTQCKSIANKTGYLHLSTGDVIRDLIKNPGSWDAALVAEVKAVTEHGDLIDDALTLKILKEEMARHPYACGFLLDGYPRTTEQARLFEEQVRPCDKVIFFDVTDAAMAERISQRSQGDTRADSSPETVRHRLDIYRQSTQPAITYLRETHPDRFVRIDGMGSIAEVSKQVEALFDKPVMTPVVSVGMKGMFAKEEKISQVDPVSGRNLANRPTYMI